MGNRKEKVTVQTQILEDETQDTETSRDLYLREGRTLSVKAVGGEDLVEIRSASGQIEVRIRLTEDGPVLQMEAARLQLRATECVEIESKHVAIKATEHASLESAGTLHVSSELDMKVETKGENVIKGQPIQLNPNPDGR